MLNQKVVLEILTKLNMIQQSKKANDELKMLSEVFTEDCRNMTDDQFKAATSEHRRCSRWFPTPADIISQHNQIQKTMVYTKRQYLPMPELTPEQIEENIARCRKIKEMIARKRSM